jgi:hypothetical protein
MPNRHLGTCVLISLVGFGSLAIMGLEPHQALLSAIAAPQQISPPVRPGEPYGRAQQRLLAKGWRPQPPPPPPTSSNMQSAQPGAPIPELVACATTGPGFCRFQWQSPQGQSWAIITVGANPKGNPGSVSTWFVNR